MDNDTLPPEIYEWIIVSLEDFKSTNGHGSLEMNIQDGHILTYGKKVSHKASGRERIRTRSKQ
jgi:hypothetical protein